MARHPITSGERSGLAALATVTLAVALTGVFWKSCSSKGNGDNQESPLPTIISESDSTGNRSRSNRDKRHGDNSEYDYKNYENDIDDYFYFRTKRQKREKHSRKRKESHRSTRSTRDDWTPRDMLEDTVDQIP